MIFRFVQAQNAVYPVTILCRVVGVSRGGYYAWAARQARPSARRQRDQVLRSALRELQTKGRGEVYTEAHDWQPPRRRQASP